ncbi:MAG: hypothetical protein R3C56_29205 [Pirellulaceae bacterium]
MSRLHSLMILCAVISLCATNSACAGVVLTFDPSVNELTLPQSGTTSFTIAVRLNAEVGTASVSGYDIPIDLAPAVGRGLPDGWSISGFTRLTDFGSGDLFFSGGDPFELGEGDFLKGDATLGDPLVFNTDPTALFSFTIDVASTAQPGSYTASIVDGALISIGGFARNQIALPDAASITVHAVPEPTGLVVLWSAVTCAFYRRRTSIARM